jgi:hypothetical protein
LLSLPHAIFIIVSVELENIGERFMMSAYEICDVLAVKLDDVFKRKFVGGSKLIEI